MRLRVSTTIALAAAAVLAGCAPAARAPRALAVVPATSADVVARVRAGGAPVTLVNVWATWCGPCREEFPALLAVARRHPEARLLLVSADFASESLAVRAFLVAHGVRDTTYLKHEGDQTFIDGFDPHWTGALPATLVYDARGRQVAFWEGAADSTRFEAAILAASHATP